MKKSYEIKIKGKDRLYMLMKIIESYIEYFGFPEDEQDELAKEIYEKLFKLYYGNK